MSRDVRGAQGACFEDLPADRRPGGGQRVLFVGALKRGIVTDTVAEYSD